MDGCENGENDEKENVFFQSNLGQWMTLSGESEVQTKSRIG